MNALAPLLAHYGGIDEIGIFVVPAVAVILILRWAERRARHKLEVDGGEPGGQGDESDRIEPPSGDG